VSWEVGVEKRFFGGHGGGMFTGEIGVMVMAVLWLLLCFRFWWLVGRRNPGQRHLLAIAGGLGAGLIYVLGHLVIGLLRAPTKQEAEWRERPGSGEGIRIRPVVEPKE
jgi:hypothetical protein